MRIYIPNSLWTWSFLGIALIQAIAALALEGYVFGTFQSSLIDFEVTRNDPEARAIPTYMALLIFAFIFQIGIVYDALRRGNTIQVIGICIYNIGILTYTGIQIDQVHRAINVLAENAKIKPDTWHQVRGPVIGVPIVIAVCSLLFMYTAWKLYDAFAWTIWKHTKADVMMKQRLLMYQIYIALLKFDFFFFLGFTVQFLVVVVNTSNLEFILTVIAVPVTIIILLAAAYWVRHENIWGMFFVIFIWFASLAYFLFKLVRMYGAHAARIADYLPIRKSLTTFAVLTIILLVITTIVSIICTRNFDRGLKQLLKERNTKSTAPESVMSGGYYNPPKARQTID